MGLTVHEIGRDERMNRDLSRIADALERIAAVMETRQPPTKPPTTRKEERA